jgi:hypothetical protein
MKAAENRIVDQSLYLKGRTNSMSKHKRVLKAYEGAKSPISGPLHACRNAAAKLDELRIKVLRMLAFDSDTGAELPQALLERAVAEAEALAWTTPYPLLFLPALAEEKVVHARQWSERQQEILAREGAAVAIVSNARNS